MKAMTIGFRSAALVLALVFAACRGGREEAGQAEEAAPAAEATTAETATETAEPEGQPISESAVGEAAATPPGAVAPAEGVEKPAVKNWMLIEFARAIEEADLKWLEENGFRVDTVMGETTVRGWLENPAGGPVISQDPRIAKIQAQMR